ncbi:MAG: methyltransferase domain-containing protein [Kofleriaceae bacterium]
MIARKADPETRRHLDELGICDGWTCLEIGAGSGTLAQWMAGRVGPSGRVVATDLDTRSLDALKVKNLEVKNLNVDEEPLPAGNDLVVARYLFEWLNNPQAVLDKIIGSLAPNGWVLIESGDWGAMPPIGTGSPAPLKKVREEFFDFLNQSSGYNPDIGRQLIGLLEAAGLEHVGADGRSVLLRGRSPEVQLYKYELEMAGAQMIEAGRLTNMELAAVLKIYDDPKFCMMSPLTTTVWGRKPD